MWWVATKDDAQLLSNRPRQVRAALGNRGDQWMWQCMSSILKLKPCQPGLPQLGIGCVLVYGGGERRTAKILQLTREDNDGGVWTLHTQEMTQDFSYTFLVYFSDHIMAVGEAIITSLVMKSKQRLFKIKCLHSRLGRAVRRVDNNLHFNAPGNRSLQAFIAIPGCTTGATCVETPSKYTVTRSNFCRFHYF